MAFLGVLYLAAGLVLLAHTALQTDLWLAARRVAATRRTLEPECRPGAEPPRVLVQLPLYNEPLVAERLLEAVCGMRYPNAGWQVQVLDDSTDVTSEIVSQWLARRRILSTEPDVVHLRRAHRTGYKAGALAAGLDHAADAELVVVFDADFLPDPDFLLRTVPRFDSPDVAAVQCRWGHLNADESWLTRAEAVMLDNHFAVEQQGRQARGAFGAFNGSAGVLRVTALRAVGGWRSTTLTEDFDMSLRLQLAGWRVVYDPSVVVPAELPGTIAGLLLQQHRWMRGVAQNTRLHLRAVLASRLRLRVRVHLLGQVLETATFAAMALQLVLAGPVAVAAASGRVPAVLAANVPLAAAFLGLLPVYAFSLRHVSPSIAVRAGRYGGFVLLSAGLTLHNAAAVILGWTGRQAEFERTPKLGGGTVGPPVPHRARAPQLVACALGASVLAGVVAVMTLAPRSAAYLWPAAAWCAGSLAVVEVRRRERRGRVETLTRAARDPAQGPEGPGHVTSPRGT